MTTLQILHYAALAAGYALALARLTDTARPLWGFLPAKLQPLFPALLVVLPDLATGLQNVKAPQDVANVVLAAAGALLVSLRGAVPAAHFEQLSEPAKKEIAAVRAGDKPKDPPAPWFPPGAGGAVGLAFLLAVTLCLPVTTSCSSPPKDPASAGAEARQAAKMVYAIGALAVNTGEEARIAWMRAVASPLPFELEVAANVNGGLHAAHDALAAAKPWIETGTGDETAAKRQLREAVAALVLVADSFGKVGRPLPPEVLDGLKLASAVLGGAS